MLPPPRSRKPPPAPVEDDDATVVMPPPGRAGQAARPAPAVAAAPRRRWPWLLGGLLVAGGAGGLAVALLRPAPPPAVAPVVPAPRPAAPAAVPAPKPVAPQAAPVPPASQAPQAAPPVPAFALRSADAAGILADPATRLTIFRFAPEPSVVVLDFPTLDQQGQMLNRVAALVEKARLPRNHVLTDAELATAIRESGDTAATYYYGHDYPVAALVRFFALADQEHVALDPEEERLRALMRQLGWFAPGAPNSGVRGALISLPRPGADPDITAPMRAAILQHELSHGAFFAEPAYAAYVKQFWLTALTAAERAAVRKFLGSEDYDTADEALMYNEMQAYLMFTYDPHFFLPSNIGMTPARRAELQVEFRRDLPVPWLRAAMVAAGVGNPPPVLPAAATRALSSSSAPRQPAAAHR